MVRAGGDLPQPSGTGVELLDPDTVFQLLKTRGVTVVDVSGNDAAGLIDGSVRVPAVDVAPFARVPELVRRFANQGLVIFACQDAQMPHCATRYREQADKRQRVAILRGGVREWQARNLPMRSTVEKSTQSPVKRASRSPQIMLRPEGRYRAPVLPNTVPTNGGVEHLDPETVSKLLAEKRCVLVDLRGDDRAAGIIPGAVHEPAIDRVPFTSKVPGLVQRWANETLVVFTCQYSAHRAPQCANWYREQADSKQRVAILAGGFRGWEARKLPVSSLASDDQAAIADDFAIRQGVHFVQQHAPQVYRRAQAFTQHLQNSHPTQETGRLETTYGRMETTYGYKADPVHDAGASPAHTLPNKPSYVPQSLPTTVPAIAGVEHLDPQIVLEFMKKGSCVLVDLRGDDRAAGLIDGATHVPAIDSVPFVTKVPDLVQKWIGESLVVFTCQYSAHRAPQCANWYREQSNPQQRVGILTGGFRGWQAKGLPVLSAASVEESISADDFAMHQGVHFVKQHAPQIYQRALALQPQKVKNTSSAPSSQHTEVGAEPLPLQTVVDRSAKTCATHLPTSVPTSGGVEHLEPEAVHEHLKGRTGILIDLRDEDRASGLIEHAVHVPAVDMATKVHFVDRVPELVSRFGQEPLVIFTCQYSAHRAPQCANWYREKCDSAQRVAILSGGFRGWESRGLPVASPSKTKEESLEADAFAMQQGIQFVKQHAPQIFQRAQNLLPQKPQSGTQVCPESIHDEAQVKNSKESQGIAQKCVHEEGLKAAQGPQGEERDRQCQRTPDARERHAPDSALHKKGPSRISCGPNSARVSQQKPQSTRKPSHLPQFQQRAQMLREGQKEQKPRTFSRAQPTTPKQGYAAPTLPSEGHLQGQEQLPEATNLTVGTPHAVVPQVVMRSDTPRSPDTASEVHLAVTPVIATRTTPAAPALVPMFPRSVLPVAEGVEKFEPETVFQLLSDGAAILVDLRDRDRSAGLIEGALHVPAIDTIPFPAKLPSLTSAWAQEPLVIFTCQYSAHRAPQCANQYRELTSPTQRVGVLTGGFRGWEAKGLPVQSAAETAEAGAAADRHAITQGSAFAMAQQNFACSGCA